MNEDIKKRFEEKLGYVFNLKSDRENAWLWIEQELKQAKIDENKKWAKATKLDSVNSFNFNNRISELKEKL